MVSRAVPNDARRGWKTSTSADRNADILGADGLLGSLIQYEA